MTLIHLGVNRKEGMRGYSLQILDFIRITIILSTRNGVHVQFSLGAWRSEMNFGLGWWDKEKGAKQ